MTQMLLCSPETHGPLGRQVRVSVILMLMWYQHTRYGQLKSSVSKSTQHLEKLQT